jgi:hypothetical protein
MINDCWDTKRNHRKSAVECLSILQTQCHILSGVKFDIYFSTPPNQDHFLSHVYAYLTGKGYNIHHHHDFSSRKDRPLSFFTSNVQKSKGIIAFLNTEYQVNETCMLELKEARKIAPFTPIVYVFIEPRSFEWVTDDMLDICDMKAGLSKIVDLSSIASLAWKDYDESGTEIHNGSESEMLSSEMLSNLQLAMKPLLRMLNDGGCTPSFSQGNN